MHYEALDLPISATAQDIRRAYLQLAARWHPDKWAMAGAAAQDGAAVRFKAVKAAYDVLFIAPAGRDATAR